MHSKAMYVYVLASKTRCLYVGVTNDLVRRVWQHRSGKVPGFTKKYSVTRVVYYEAFTMPRIGLPTARRADPSPRSG
ncbi:MAG: GIY-YIG nuclease family protein [Gemmatimonadales bacterium]|nr:GIY-YIG nuclease family protein [Gemmatimonadales bacterium]